MPRQRGAHPSPSPAPRVALHQDVLRGGTGSTDPVDGGLVEVEDESLVHVVVLVVGVPDDFRVGCKQLGRRGPPGLEAGHIGDYLFVVAAFFIFIFIFNFFTVVSLSCVLQSWLVFGS